MNKKLQYYKLFVLVLLIASSVLLNSTIAQKVFEEEESLLIVEIESANLISGWTQDNTTVSGEAITYYYNHVQDYFSTPGNSTLEYKIKINNPGVYRFQWHCKVGEGTSATEANDSWLKIPDADDFYAEKLPSGLIRDGLEAIGNIVHPKGVCVSDCPDGAGKNGWFKVYSNGTTDWSWRSSTYDGDPHAIFARFDQVGTYSVQISARSKHQFLNRFVLYKTTEYTENEATNLSLPENSLLSNSISNSLLDEMNVYPNPTKDQLTLSGKNNNIEDYEIINLSGVTMLSGAINNRVERVDVSSLQDGIYILKCYDVDKKPKITRFTKKQ